MNLSKVEFKILSIVATDELPGREVALRYGKENKKRLSYGTLYTTCSRLREKGLLSVRDSVDGDGRVRYFLATGRGINALNKARAEFSALANFGLDHVPA